MCAGRFEREKHTQARALAGETKDASTAEAVSNGAVLMRSGVL
jgi:hypothetical protein